MQKHIAREFVLWLIGGFIYTYLELVCRGRTHPSMYIVGGVCFLLIGLINEWFTFKASLVFQMLLSSVFVTAVEFCTGVIVNIVLGLNVWDYSNMPFNVLGQICLPFSLLWFAISLAAIILDDWIRYKWFGEEKLHYRLFPWSK